MVTIVISEFMNEASVERLRAAYDVTYDPALVDEPERLLELVGDCRALIVRNRTQVRGALLNAAGNVECIGRLGVGLDNIDLAACRTRGIEVIPASGANDDSVAEYVITSAQMLLRGAYQSTGAMLAGEWPRG